MSYAKIGDEVEVSFKGKVVRIESMPGLATCLIIRSDEGTGFEHALYEGAKDQDFTVTVTDPEYWPPQAGDVWEHEGRSYFAKNTSSGVRMMMVPAVYGSSGSYQENLAYHSSRRKAGLPQVLTFWGRFPGPRIGKYYDYSFRKRLKG